MMIPVRFDPKHKSRGVGALVVRGGYGVYMGDIIWVPPDALNVLEELGIPYERVSNRNAANAKKKPSRKKSLHSR